MNFQNDQTHDEEVTLELTPLIDMVFQLLVFFLLTTTFAVNVKEGGIELNLPRAKSAQIPSLAKQVVIAILKDGRIVLGGETISESELEKQLKTLHEENPQTMVVVQADQKTEHWQVVNVMDLAVSIGLKRLAIATVEE